MCALRFLYGVTLGHDAIPERFSYSDGKVRFTWKDYRLDGTTKLMTLDANEFIRRFLLHALRASTGFVTTASSPTANAATPLSAACCSMPITPWPIQSWRTVTPKRSAGTTTPVTSSSAPIAAAPCGGSADSQPCRAHPPISHFHCDTS